MAINEPERDPRLHTYQLILLAACCDVASAARSITALLKLGRFVNHNRRVAVPTTKPLVQISAIIKNDGFSELIWKLLMVIRAQNNDPR